MTIKNVFGHATIPAAPKRIVALGAGTDTDILYALGVQPVGIATFPGFDGTNAQGVLWWEVPHLDAGKTTLLPEGSNGVNVEQVAKLRPDLILSTYGALTQSAYQQLSQIAPVVASPGHGQWELDWRQDLATVGQAIGMSEQAKALETKTDATIAAVKAAHPQLAGVTFTFLDVEPNQLWPFLDADPRVQLMNELGLVSSPGVKALDKSTHGAFEQGVSFERAASIDADILIAYTSAGTAQSLHNTPVFGGLPTVTAGAVAFYGKADSKFLDALQPSPLTIPIAIKRLASDASAAVAHIHQKTG